MNRSPRRDKARLLFQIRPHNRHPDRVAFRVHVQIVFQKNVGLRLSVFTKHRRKNIDKRQLGIFFDEILDQLVRRFDLFNLRPARACLCLAIRLRCLHEDRDTDRTL